MTDEKDGGSAFPVSDQGQNGCYGMTLRDWFAGQSLTGVISVFAMTQTNDQDGSRAAKMAYVLADAMLKERSK